MARVYDVYEDFKMEMENISHFFNLEYKEKNPSNEEMVFNLLEKQLRENNVNKQDVKKDILAGCVNILQEQNKISKHATSKKKNKRATIISNANDKQEHISETKKITNTNENKNTILDDAEAIKNIIQPLTKSNNHSIVNFLDEEFDTSDKQEKTDSNTDSNNVKKSSQTDFLSDEDILFNKSCTIPNTNAENIKKKSVDNDHNFVDTIKKTFEQSTQTINEKGYNVDHIINCFSTLKPQQTDTPLKKDLKENRYVDSKEKESENKPQEQKLDFERNYFKDGKYIIDAVTLSTSVFVKKSSRVDVKNVPKVEAENKKCEKESKDIENKKQSAESINKNKNFKIDCNIDQNLLNGCYWPTQLS